MEWTRKGFTLMEVIVTLALLAVIGTIVVLTGSPESPNDRQRYAVVSDALWDIAKAIAGNESHLTATSFRQVIGVYPSKLSDLTKPITGAGKNICNVAYTTPAQTSLWLNPFYRREFLTAGTPLASGFTAQDALVAVSVSPTTPGILAIRMPGTSLRDAQGLDLTVDGASNGASGIIRYANTDPTSVDYYVTVTGC